ncbi:transposase [Pedobacter sp. AK017]|uniref:IS66 family insertion sequence element accessory protein TnpB n=1 Tax=Pedobacter sp. AK017 TaxID=2723073 RepID=UPI001608B1C4|nr:IS66 family insertion sequence element accessory protein TnpB [Pedobacter sp. AK017]MBB5440585.1 transposase [Pedobacter sp. AK017]
MYDPLDNRRYFMYPFTVSMCKGIDGLSGVVRSQLKQNPRCGDAFIFFNKIKNYMKVLFYDDNGYAMYVKRIDMGRFQVPAGRADDLGFYISRLQLLQLIRGLRMNCVFAQKRPEDQNIIWGKNAPGVN